MCRDTIVVDRKVAGCVGQKRLLLPSSRVMEETLTCFARIYKAPQKAHMGWADGSNQLGPKLIMGWLEAQMK